jgi:hypothetical protein
MIPRASVVIAAVAVAMTTGLQQRDPTGQTADPKLTTVLADLARAVPQDEGATPSARAAPAALPADSLPDSVRDAMRSRKLRVNARNEVQVYVLVDAVTDDTLRRLSASGATIEITDAPRRRVQARIPASRLRAVAALPFVTFVRLPTYAVRRIGAVTTEGDAIVRADAVRRQLSLDGTGVRVGVVSDGLKGVFATGCTSCGGVAGGPIATADLPGATGTRNALGVLTASSGGIIGRSFQANNDLEGLPPATPACAFPGAGAEGTAILEIVHDLAPGAQLSFANADTDLAFNQAVNFLAATNDVVIDDLGFFGDAYDGTSAVSRNTANALNNGSFPVRAYVTSVGNEADEHYLGTYVDSAVDGLSISGIANAGHLHLFQQSEDTTDVLGLGPQPYNVVSLPRSGEIAIFLTWDDAFGAASNNYDLYLVQQSTGRVVAKSTDPQSGTQDPLEVIDFTNTGANDLFRIVVQNVRDQARPKVLNLYSFSPECAADGPRPLAPNRHERHNYNTATRSVAAQGDAGGSPVSVISVGAICSASAAAASRFSGTNESCNDRTNSTIEFFSSRGPTIDGRQKPDISSIDGVTVTGAGGFVTTFFGTSAAAPHVAGLAALVLQAAPCLIAGTSGASDSVTARTTLRRLIVGNASAVDGAPPDNVVGSGRSDAFASTQSTLPVFNGTPALTVSGNTALGASLSAAQLGFADPNQCALTRLSWSGGCGTSPGSTLNCPFGTARVSVAASNNGVGFSGATDIQITVTNFLVGAAPASATLNAGQSAVYQVTVSAQGGAFTNSVMLGCSNLPPGGSCSFSPPAVAPGAGAAQATLTVATTARSSSVSIREAAFLIACLAFGAMPRRVRPRRFAVPLGVAFVATAFACSRGGTSTPPNTQPPSSAPAAAVSPASLTFNAQTVQTTSAPQTVTLANGGNAALSVTSIAASGDFAQTNTCGTSVAAGGNCAISVTFTPTAAGARAGALTVADNAANSPQTVGLTGTGASASAGTPAGTYQIGITGSSGALTQSGAVTLVVQ